MSEHAKAGTLQKSNPVPAPNQARSSPIIQGSNSEAIIQKAQMCPESLTHSDIIQLQHTIGNHAVLQLFRDINNIEPARKKEPVQAKAEPSEDDKKVLPESVQKKENKTGLPDNLKAGVEKMSGMDMSSVRVHYNSDKPAQVEALAYTQGTDIHVAPGQEKHLPHEAWHVVQQAQGRVRETRQLQGIGVNDDTGLEREADEMAQKALGFSGAGTGNLKQATPYTGAVQRVGWESLGWLNPRRYIPEFVGGYDEKTMKKIHQKELYEKKKSIVSKVIGANLKAGAVGWFELRDDQLELYTDRVFGFLEQIRHKDMEALMIAQQQVNDEALATPEEKVKTLTKHIQHNTKEINKLKDFDIEIFKEKHRKKQEEIKTLNLKLQANVPKAGGMRIKRRTKSKSPGEGVLKSLRQRTGMIGEEEALAKKIKELETLKRKGSPEIAKLEKLKLHKQRMEREKGFQKVLAGRKGFNIDFMNTSDVDGGKEYVAAYMAIVSPNYDNKYKDFYLNDSKDVTYSANDKIMWISFGTPYRTLSWFQKYALDAPGDNVPLVRSFMLPMEYFEKHIKNLTNEDPKSEPGRKLKKERYTLDLGDYYGTSESGKKYKGEIAVIDPFLMNVDIKYPNQFGLGKGKETEESTDDKGIFDKNKQRAGILEEEMKSRQYDEQIKSIEEEIEKLNKAQGEVLNNEFTECTDKQTEITNLIANIDVDSLNGPYNALKYIKNLKAKEEVGSVAESIKIVSLRLIHQTLYDFKIEERKKFEKKIKEEKEKFTSEIKGISGGESGLKSEITKRMNRIQKAVAEVEASMTSTIMRDLIEHAVPNSFKTIALASDRKYEHVQDKEGELQDYGEFLTSLGLDYGGDAGEFHLLDEDYTAFHHKSKDDKWSSQSPTHTEEIYNKMRFFFHALDSQTQDMPEVPQESVDKAPVDNLDISMDSHLQKALLQIQKDSKINSKIEKLAAAFKATNVEQHLSVILNQNHFTPADVLGLPANMESTRKDRHGNSIVKTAAESYFAEKVMESDTSLTFIADNVTGFINELSKPAKVKDLGAKLLENTYIKRDIQEILGIRSGDAGIEADIPFTKESIIKALEALKDIKSVKSKHGRMRMVYLFFHIMRPLAHALNENASKKAEPIDNEDSELPKKDLIVNNREEVLSHFDFLSSRTKPFGIMEERFSAPDEESAMPYDKNRSPMRYVAKDGNEMTEYMRRLDMPFVGGVSGTTRDQNQVLENIFDINTLKKSYWDFQLLNAAFMIGNGYHSFFETIYVAARFDKYMGRGEEVLKEFAKLKDKNAGSYEIYAGILKIIGAKDEIFKGFEDWYAKKIGKHETQALDQVSRIKTVKSVSIPKGVPSKVTATLTGTKTANTGLTTPAIPNISQDYLYEDNDVYRIMNLLVAQHNLQNVHVIPPVDDIVSEQLEQRLREDFGQHQGTARKLLIPYNKGNYHWIGILLDITANEAQVAAYVMDPAQHTNGFAGAPAIEAEIKKVYANATIQAAAHLVQKDATSCGVLTIENLIARARGLGVGADQLVDAGAGILRQAHVDIMTVQRPELNFAHKQKFNLYTFSNFDVRAYLSGKGQNKMSVSERKAVFEIINQFKKYPELKEIVSAFGALAKDSISKEILDKIREELEKVLQRLKHGDNAQEKKEFLAVISKLFAVDAMTLDDVATLTDTSVRNALLIENIGAYIEKASGTEDMEAVLKKLEEQKSLMEKQITTGKQ